MRTGEALLKRHANPLEGFLHHEFFHQVEQGTLSRTARDAYFVYEHRFVEEAVVVLGHILTKAPTTASRTHIVSMLHGLVTDQFAMFDRILARIGRPTRATPASVANFCVGMTAISRDGSYAEGLAAMFAAEWTYARVSERLRAATVEDELLRDWFDLHTQPRFLEGVAWLEAELDAVAHAHAPEVSETFLRAIALEIDFHDAPLRDFA